MKSGFALFDHTADVGVRAFAASLPELIAPAIEGLYACIGELKAVESAGPAVAIEHTGDDAALLLRDLLADVLMRFEGAGEMLCPVASVEFEPPLLRVRGEWRAVDESESVLFREVKAVTYHALRVTPIEGGFEAIYIVDI
jgi:SHS2 domain-containing protein